MSVVGICTDMCPREEILFREKHNLLASFEASENIGTSKRIKWKADPLKCVKEFRRSAAGEDISSPKCLRVPEVLLKTTEYLLREILSMETHFPAIYDFIFDRLRSVRQDVSIQQIQNTHIALYTEILMNCVKFYIFANYQISQKKITNIDKHINNAHLKETMNLLFVHCCGNLVLLEKSRNALNAVICYLLYDVESSNSLSMVLQNVPKHIRKRNSLQLTIQLKLNLLNLNLVAANKCIRELMESSQTIVKLFLSPVIGYFRTLLLKIYNTSHSSKVGKFPMPLLTYLLLFTNNTETTKLCKSINMNIVENNVLFSKASIIDIDTLDYDYANLSDFINGDITKLLL